MDSILDQIIDEDLKSFIQLFEESTKQLEKDIKIKMDAFNRYIQSTDMNEILDLLHMGKENLDSTNIATTKKPRRVGKKALMDLSESFNTEGSDMEDNPIKIKIEKEMMPAPTVLPLKKRIKKEPVENKDEQIPKRSTRTKTKLKNMQETEGQNKKQRSNSDVIVQETSIPIIEVPDSESDNESSRQTNSKRNQIRVKDVDTNLDGTFTVTKKKTEIEVEPLQTRSTRTKTLRKYNTETNEEKKIDGVTTGSENSNGVENPTPANIKFIAKSGNNRTDSTDTVAHKTPLNIVNNKKLTPAADRTIIVEKPVLTKNIVNLGESQKSPEIRLRKNEVFSPYKKTPLKDKVAAFEKLKNTPASETKNKTPLALQRKGTILKTQSEEIKKKREFKQQRAQQLRENLAKEKQKNLEMLKKKDENLKKIELENPKKLQTPSDVAKVISKLNIAQQNYSNSQSTGIVRPPTIKKQKLESKIPLYMTIEMPLLPTDDCYDSDDEKCKRLIKRPAWSREPNLTKTLKTMDFVGESLKNTLFCRTTYSPDLLEIFEYVHPAKLRRNSSAIWRSPPRYTLFSVTRDIQFSDDDD